jgi:DNA repair ATPase RecN
MLALLFLLAQSLDLNSVKAEPNLDRRAELALDNAGASLDRAKTLYANAEYEKSQEATREIADSVEVCLEALKATGKDFRKNAKQFKRIEMRIQLLVRRVKGFAQSVSVQDRPEIVKVQHRLEEINDEIVTGIFTRSAK